ncbi:MULTISPECIES: alpha/beta hydrolase [Legionella]|uniref:Carboxylesterase n=1 Tax=Legionella septentrionalis TaxID=2498109 RepID=A0A3S0V565_9GAMM|nr:MULTISPECIES: carboxylesterase [Legionella]MCP0913850.1 carboxylesterase [Legionella sp. 27cVA30]RUQ85279.1 carboxylesterase [Legionella septentrionalis]RUQ98697.1 carboxylesterase [Legionella septentrionalis]RUR09931.1 carboxylesterase [Legionella septentrionalis]RUR14990.1 carboxylesterase [Legionella septentrionalis]
MDAYIKEQANPKACVIWMHGLGADAQDMAGLTEQLSINIPVRHICVNAAVRPVTMNNNFPMRAWFDIANLDFNEFGEPAGIFDSERMIQEIIANQIGQGLTHEQIFLAGFSQGGAMALFAGLRSSTPLGGIIALSSFLPNVLQVQQMHKNIPVFMAAGIYDQIVLPVWTKASMNWLQAQGFANITYREYPLEHSISMQEIQDLSHWFNQQLPVVSGGAR